MYNSPELQYACLLHLSSLTEPEKDLLKNEVERTKEPATVAHGDVHIVCNCISSEQSAKMYEGIGSVPSLQIGQYEASLMEREMKQS